LDGELGEPGGNIGCGDGDGDLGAAYARPASSMVGTNKDSAKAQKHTGGCKMLDTLLSEARKSGDKTPVMRHFQDLSYRLSNSTIMPYNAKAAALAFASAGTARTIVKRLSCGVTNYPRGPMGRGAWFHAGIW
jgi:hypothetical protein